MLDYNTKLKELCESENLPFDVIYRNLWKFSDIYDKYCHLEDLKLVLDDCYDVDKIPDHLLECMLASYEDKLADFGSENGWNYIFSDILDEYKNDLEEYKITKEVIE